MKNVEAEPLLVKVMEKGKLTYDLPSLEKIRAKAAKNLAELARGVQGSNGCT